jgi:hypothetical protein
LQPAEHVVLSAVQDAQLLTWHASHTPPFKRYPVLQAVATVALVHVLAPVPHAEQSNLPAKTLYPVMHVPHVFDCMHEAQLVNIPALAASNVRRMRTLRNMSL